MKNNNLKNSLLLFIIAFVSTEIVLGQKFEFKINVDNKEREFIVSKPETASGSNGYPVVFMLHGTSGDGEKFYNISGWKELGEKEKVLTVFPSSLRYCVLDKDGNRGSTTKWNNGDLYSHACPNQTLKDDVKFLRHIIDTLKQIFPINSNMIYVSGFSNGGVMAAKLSVEMQDVFSAASCTGAFMDVDDSMYVSNKIPVWNMIGTHDSMFIERSGYPYIPFNDTCLQYLRTGIHAYLGSFGLDSTYKKSSDSLTLNYRYSSPLPGEKPGLLIHTLIKGMGHQYPNGSNFEGFRSAPMLWEFFKQFSKRTTSLDNTDKKMECYPNPFYSSVEINFYTSIQSIEIYDLSGIKYYSDQSVMTNVIDLSKLPPQLYIFKFYLSNGKTHITKLLKI